jgi:hypothetical protein
MKAKRSKKPARKRSKFASLKDFAAVEFQPWTRRPDGKMLPSAELMKQIGISARLAYAILLRTKAELMDMRKQVGDEALDEVMNGMQADREAAKELVKMMEAAQLRMISAVASAEMAEATRRKRKAA